VNGRQDARRGASQRRPKNLCLDKGYDYADTEQEVRKRRVTPHLRRRGEKPRRCKRGRARRWVVERTNSWHNNFRALRDRGRERERDHVHAHHHGNVRFTGIDRPFAQAAAAI
jgi:IS5 family transposase